MKIDKEFMKKIQPFLLFLAIVAALVFIVAFVKILAFLLVLFHLFSSSSVAYLFAWIFTILAIIGVVDPRCD